MFQIDGPGSSPTLPAPQAPGTPAYFQDKLLGDPLSTQVTRDFLNMTMLEIINVILAAGITPSKSTYTQLRDAIKFLATGGVIHADDVGAANAYVINPAQPLGAYAEGVTYSIKFLHANTGASTLNISSLGAKTITRTDGTALQAGDIPANSEGLVIYDGVNIQLIDEIPTTASTSVAGLVTLATATQIAAGTGTGVVTPGPMVAASAVTALIDGATTTWNLATTITAQWNVTGAGHTLALTGGQSGLSYALEAFLGAFGASWPASIDWGAGGAPVNPGGTKSLDISIRCVDPVAPRFKGSWN